MKVIRKPNDYRKNITGYTIIPTTCCNARCFYCYESDYPHRTMTDETQAKLIDFIDSHCGEERKISIGWFGGEPTLCAGRISSVCRETKKKEIEYTASMISNGYLFTREMAKTAKELWHLGMIQITLDGTAEIYNKTKAYVGVKDDPYHRVLDNIAYLLDNGISVSVRMNLDRYNAENLHELIDELADRFSERKGFSAYVHTLFDDCGFEKVHHSDEDNEALFNSQNGLEAHIRRRGIENEKSNSLPLLKSNYCMADNKCSLLVNPDGDFGKCEHYIYDKLVGSSSDGVTDRKKFDEWTEYNQWTECFDCPLYPSCFILKLCPDKRSCEGNERKKKTEQAEGNLIKSYADHIKIFF